MEWYSRLNGGSSRGLECPDTATRPDDARSNLAQAHSPADFRNNLIACDGIVAAARTDDVGWHAPRDV
jgi:hypothetical protein